MKKVLIALVLLLALGVALLIGLSNHVLVGLMNPDKDILYKLADHFLRGIQFKDFANSAALHSWADSQKADIPGMIERLFKIKPEVLDMRSFRITDVDIDESGMRAKTPFSVNYVVLNSARGEDGKNEEKELEGILYWHKLPKGEAEAPPSAPGSPPTAQVSPLPGAPVKIPVPVYVDPQGNRWFLRLESSLR